MTADDASPRETVRRLTNGFQVSQAIYVAASLGLADLLREGPRSVDDLAAATGTTAAALNRLLRALASIGIFADVGGRFGQTALSNYLRSDVTGSLRAWARRIGRPDHWRTWGELERSLRSGTSAFRELYGVTAWDWRAARPEENAIFNAAMTGLFGRHGRVDRGGPRFLADPLDGRCRRWGRGAARGDPCRHPSHARHRVRSTACRHWCTRGARAGRRDRSLRARGRELLRDHPTWG